MLKHGHEAKSHGSPLAKWNVSVTGNRYVWLIWSSAFLVPWLALFFSFPRYRAVIGWTSIMTMPFGLTEPLFVPSYWNPPSLFDLAQRTGFDIESLIFSFAIGGVGVSLYSILTGRMSEPVPPMADPSRHRYHGWILLIPLVTFPLLRLLPLNPIYAAVGAMLLGAGGTAVCRPDLVRNTVIGGMLFLAYYLLFMLGLEWLAPGYIARVWNLGALSGILIHRIPLEELVFGFSFGAYWAAIYEHLTWRRSVKLIERPGASSL